MCDARDEVWRCEVDGGFAVVSEAMSSPYYGTVWQVRARIPMRAAVNIAKTLMAHRRQALALDAVLAMEGG